MNTQPYNPRSEWIKEQPLAPLVGLADVLRRLPGSKGGQR